MSSPPVRVISVDPPTSGPAGGECATARVLPIAHCNNTMKRLEHLFRLAAIGSARMTDAAHACSSPVSAIASKRGTVDGAVLYTRWQLGPPA
jgi:hypothetical protein